MKCKNDKYRIVILPQEDIVPSTKVPDETQQAQQSEENQVPAEATPMETDANVCLRTKKRIYLKFNKICLSLCRPHQVLPNGYRMNSTNAYLLTQWMISKK